MDTWSENRSTWVDAIAENTTRLAQAMAEQSGARHPVRGGKTVLNREELFGREDDAQ